MGFRSSRPNRDGDDAGGERTQRLRHRSQDRSTARHASGSGRLPVERVEEQFGLELYDQETADRLQLLASDAPGRVQQWVDEGMPVDVMGDPQAIQAFRQRQEARPPEVPTNVERRNARSVQRSAEAAAETGAAGSTQVPESVRDVISSPGQSLDPSIRRAMEERMGEEFGDVRIHTGANAAAACDSIDARAFTVGNHVAFDSGEYDPSSPEGQHVLAHELAHVRQQTGGAVSMLPQEDVELEVDPDPALEREAEETARKALEGGELGFQRLADTGVHVQRAPKQTGFGDDGSVSVENVNENALREALGEERSEVNFAHVLRVLGKTGAVSIAGGALAKGGAVLAGVSDPVTAQALLALATTGTTVSAGWAALYTEIDPQVVRKTFAAAGKEDLLNRILDTLGEDVDTDSATVGEKR